MFKQLLRIAVEMAQAQGRREGGSGEGRGESAITPKSSKTYPLQVYRCNIKNISFPTMYHMYRLYGHENRELREIPGKFSLFSLGQFENLSY